MQTANILMLFLLIIVLILKLNKVFKGSGGRLFAEADQKNRPP